MSSYLICLAVLVLVSCNTLLVNSDDNLNKVQAKREYRGGFHGYGYGHGHGVPFAGGYGNPCYPANYGGYYPAYGGYPPQYGGYGGVYPGYGGYSPGSYGSYGYYYPSSYSGKGYGGQFGYPSYG